ncbi:MAG: sulfoxide reductase heme-binding subunit YedZ [Candidatus Marinimicrobia bacterium]|nr:sulfoxide reductase heme-binding subunit YedZ [Candidatus Neomarinimicrobiota bacterium]
MKAWTSRPTTDGAAAQRSSINDLIRRFSWLVHPLALAPLVLLLWQFKTDQLTANPIQFITHFTGSTALRLLLLSLAVTPVKRLAALPALTPLRKRLGLWGFFYASSHLTIFIGLDYFFDWQLLWEELSQKRYVLVGFTAWLLMLPLAVTSTKGWQKRLGRKWTLLHRLVYAVTPLAVIHFVWLVKSDYREPLIYGAVVAILLALRIKKIAARLPMLSK